MNFTNKNVLITGGSTGIGLATAKAFIEKGANVFITGKNADNLKKAAAEINNSKLKTIVSDIADMASISALAKTIADTGNKLDVLFLNAGIAPWASIEETTEKVFDDLFNINVKGLFFTLQKLIPYLAESSSVIVTSSGVSIAGYANASAYSATKSAVDAIARVAATELADRKIRVNIVAPGPIETPILYKVMPKEAVDAALDHMANNVVPLKRLGNAEEVANTVLFLASNGASYITGSYLSVDGGATVRR